MSLTRRGLLLALALAPVSPARASAERVTRLDVVHRGVDNREALVSFVRAHVGGVIGLAALVPMHVIAGSDPDRVLQYGFEGPRGRTLLRIPEGFVLQGSVRRNEWHVERTYRVDGFFRVVDRGEASARDGRVLELQRVDPPAGNVETLRDFVE